MSTAASNADGAAEVIVDLVAPVCVRRVQSKAWCWRGYLIVRSSGTAGVNQQTSQAGYLEIKLEFG
jgi:hypothetical protein